MTARTLAVGVWVLVVVVLALWVPLWYWLSDDRGL